MYDPGYPCTYCGVRPDVACRHRPAVAAIERPPVPEDRRERSYDGQGYNFRGRKVKISGGGNYGKKGKA